MDDFLKALNSDDSKEKEEAERKRREQEADKTRKEKDEADRRQREQDENRRRHDEEERRRDSSSSRQKDDEDDEPFKGSIPWGLAFLGAGIVCININERRAAKQDVLNHFCENAIQSLDDMRPRPTSTTELNGKLIHVHGDTLVDDGGTARDDALGCEAPHQLRLKRTIEMYQWKETEHTNKETKEKTYSYRKEWAQHSLNTHDHRNPSFPYFGEVTDPSSISILFNNLRFKLSPEFVARLRDFSSCSVVVADRAASQAHHLEPMSGGRGFQTVGLSEHGPAIGDVRVTYRGVPEGPHTALAKWTEEQGLVAFTAKLTSRLSKQAEIVIPKEAHELASKVTGASVLVIPEFLVELVEDMVITAAPLEFAFLERSHESKATALAHQKASCDETGQGLFWGGAMSCCLGSYLALSAVGAPILGGSAMMASGPISGMVIAHQTRKAARAQVDALTGGRQSTSSGGRSRKADLEL